MSHWVVSCENALSGISCGNTALLKCRSCIDGLWQITRHEGPSVLWHGVNVSMLISVPMICMYLPMYDFLSAELDSSSAYAPLIAGSAARAMSVVATSPVELLKTRIQAAGANTIAHSRSAATAVTPFSAALQQMRSDMKVRMPFQKAHQRSILHLRVLSLCSVVLVVCSAPTSLHQAQILQRADGKCIVASDASIVKLHWLASGYNTTAQDNGATMLMLISCAGHQTTADQQSLERSGSKLVQGCPLCWTVLDFARAIQTLAQQPYIYPAYLVWH